MAGFANCAERLTIYDDNNPMTCGCTILIECPKHEWERRMAGWEFVARNCDVMYAEYMLPQRKWWQFWK